VIIPDINLLIYAHNQADPQHTIAKDWWESGINGSEPIGLPWIVMGGFIRLMTHPRVLENPMPITDATACVRRWLDQASVIVLEPGKNFPIIFFNFLENLGSAGNLTTDAHIAALAVEKQAEVHSCDTDFARFDGLRWINPIT
jgi:toxin-antitoxin system PIN domain toxin